MADGNTGALGLAPIAPTEDHEHAHQLTHEDDDDPPIDPGARLPADLERELKRFLDDPHLAGLVPDSGSFGSQLERAESYGYGALPCRKCGGSWRTRRRASDGEQYFAEWRDGTGWVPSPKHFAAAAAAYSRALKVYRERMARELRMLIVGDGGTGAGNQQAAALFAELSPGHRLVTRDDLAELFPIIPTELCLICRSCSGIGVVPRRSPRPVQVTARPTGSSVGKAGRHPDTMVTVNLDQLAWYESMDRLLGLVASRRPVHRLVLSSYYGPAETPERALARRVGAHVGRPGLGPTGGFKSIWPFTPTARDYLDARPSRLSLDQQVTELERYAGKDPAVALPDLQKAERAPWLSAITREAWALYGAACENANQSARELRWKPWGEA